MLEKIPSNCLISKLWAILLMEADCNVNNELLFGKRMMDSVQDFNLMVEEIFSEKGHTAEDGALEKILFYDIVRQTRLPAGMSSVDATNVMTVLPI